MEHISRFLRKRFYAFYFFIIISFLLMFTIFFPSISISEEGPQKMVELVLDASGSMNGKLKSGETKIDASKKAVSELMNKLDDGLIIAFRTYGNQSPREKHDCQDTKFFVSFGEVRKNRDKIASSIKNISARGYTPITYVLQKSAEDFPQSFQGERIIILVSDGKETCKGDPCATAKRFEDKKIKLVIHTIGFGVDEATKLQLECIAGATGGKYFSAEDASQLAQVINKAVETSKTVVVKNEGFGWLEIQGADLMGHTVTKADTGEKVGVISSVHSTIKLPTGIYNVSIGKAVWKSVEVQEGETIVLKPGILRVEGASLSGHKVVERETGLEHGSVSSLKNSIALMPGEYDVMFHKIPWPVVISAGQTTILKPGTVKIEHASYKGHKIRDRHGNVVAEVSNIMDWAPLPPGDYTIEINGKKIPFSLKEGEHLKFQR
jgi:hypothetical protein